MPTKCKYSSKLGEWKSDWGIGGGESATAKSRLSKYQAYQSHFSPRISLHKIIYVNHSFCPRWERQQATAAAAEPTVECDDGDYDNNDDGSDDDDNQTECTHLVNAPVFRWCLVTHTFSVCVFFLFDTPLVRTVKRAIIFPVSTCVHKMWCMHKWIYLNRIKRNANETRLFIQCTRMNGLFRYACADDISLSIATFSSCRSVVSFSWLCFRFFFSRSTLTISLLPS